MSDFDSRLRDVLHDRAGDVDTPSMPDDVRKSVRRRRAAGGAMAVAVSAAVIAVFVLSLSVLLPLGDGGDGQPTGPTDLSDTPIMAPSKAVTTASLPFVTLEYPKSWYAVVSDDSDVSSSPEVSADHIMITNFDAGVDTGLCLDGGSTIPANGVALHIGSGTAPIAIPGDGYVDSMDELKSNGSKLAQTCSAGEVLAGGSPRDGETPAMWIVIIAGPEANRAIVDQMISIMDDGGAPVELQPSPIDASFGPVALIGEGSSQTLHWAMTIQPSAEFGALPMLAALDPYTPNKGILLGNSLAAQTDVTAFPSAPIGLGAPTKDGGWEIALGGLTFPNVARIEVQSDGPTRPFGQPTLMRVPESIFGSPVKAFEVSLEVPPGQEIGEVFLMAYDSDGILLAATALIPRGPLNNEGATMLELREDQQILDSTRAAADRSSQANLLNAKVAARVAYIDAGRTYSDITPKLLHEIEPTLEFDSETAATINTVSVRDVSDTGLVLVTRSATNTPFCAAAAVVENEATFGTQDAQTAAECVGDAWPAPG